MNIKHISLLSLLCVPATYAILPDEILDVAFNRYAKAYQAFIDCQQSQQPSACRAQENEATVKKDEYDKVMLEMKDFLNTTVQQGNKASLFELSKKQKAEAAQQVIRRIKTFEQQPTELNMGEFSGNLLNPSKVVMPWNRNAMQDFHKDLNNTIPHQSDYPFISTY